ncbi:hypothetical protein PYCC9005_000753 [Savitreella phatthalungensis]
MDVNLHEPQRAAVPAPLGAQIVPEEQAQKARPELDMANEAHHSIRSQFRPQSQPAVSTKALESTAYKPPTSNETGVGSGTNHIPSQTKSEPAEQTITGSNQRERGDEAPQHLQPEDGPAERNSTRLERESGDSSSLRSGTIERDEDDPDAQYRLVRGDTQLFEEDAKVELTKDELEIEKKERKLRRRQKLVKDPVTGQDIWIGNHTGSIRRALQTEGVVAPKFAALKGEDSAATELLRKLHKIPFKDDKTNVLFYPMEVPEWRDLRDEAIRSIFQWGYILIFAMACIQLTLSFLPSRYSLWLNIAAGVVSVLFVRNRIETLYNDSFGAAEKVRGEIATVQALPESVEWLNNIIRTIWPTINPELFASPVDLLEDVLQRQVPGVVHTVKVSDLDIGAVPLRVTSMRYLPDDGAPRGDEDSSGEYVNLEVSYGYRAGRSGSSKHTQKAQNIHLLIWFLVGLRNVLGIPIPIWVEVHGIMGKARVRVQLLPDPPFVKNCTLTLLGQPKVELSTRPITTHFINVMNLPFVSQLVAFAVKTVAKGFIAPRSYTLDLSKLMIGDDVKKETAAIGVLMIAMHGATDLPRTDHRPGKSKIDPYLTVQFSNFGKTMYSTRVIAQDRQPVWEETCFLPILPGSVKAAERVRINLWDSDRLTADDHVGRVEVDLTTLVLNPGKLERRRDHIVGTRKGQLSWSIGFFGKKAIDDEVEIPPAVDARVPEALRDDPAFRPEEARWCFDSRTEKIIGRTPPDYNFPGILSVQIHQITDLGVVRPRDKIHSRNGMALAGKVEQGKEDDSGTAPSSYCCVILNDELVYKTRTRAYTNRPIFNASFERFLRSARDAKLRLVVRDQRFREADPIVGILPLALADELATQGQITRWYPLSEGIGYGVIRVSLLFRNCSNKIPRSLQGWNVGTLHIHAVRAVCSDNHHLPDNCSLRIDAVLGHKSISSFNAHKYGDNGVMWQVGSPIVFPVRRRHATSLSFELHKPGLFTNVIGASLVSLSSIDDDVRNVIKLPIFEPDDSHRFRQNSLSQADMVPVGYLECDLILVKGLSDVHRKFIKRSNDLAQTHESWEAERDHFERLSYERALEQKLREKQHHNKSLSRRSSGSSSSNSDASSIRRPEGNILLPGARKIKFVRDKEGNDIDQDSGAGQADEPVVEEDDEWDSHSNSSLESVAALDPAAHRRRRNSASKVFTAPKQWYEETQRSRREKHRRHRGIMQQKSARTAVWMKNGVQKGVSKMSKALSLNREDNMVEREV